MNFHTQLISFSYTLECDSPFRSCKLFKHEYGNVDKVYQTGQRSAMACFRCGIVPINIELGRYVNVPADQRFCHVIDNCIEDEVHTVVRCRMYIKSAE